MKKKVITLLAAITLVVPVNSIFAESQVPEERPLTAKQLEVESLAKERFTQENNESHSKRLELYNQIKSDSDFEIFADDGNGNFAYTNSKNLKSDQDKNRFLLKVENIEAQKAVNGYTKVEKLQGYMENYIKDTVSIDKPLFGGTDTLVFSGTNTIQWFKDKSTYENWSKLTGITDNFTVGYSYVSSTTSGVNVGISGGTIPTPSGNASYSWVTTNTSATQSFSWPDKGTYFYYGKTYGNFTVKTLEINDYTHNSFAIAIVGGENILVNATASTSF